MLLARLEIENFLSIRKSELHFDSKCLVLVGKNESGKSNVLKALSYLKPSVLPIASDIRAQLIGERNSKQSHIRFVFKLSPSEVNKLSEIFSAAFLSKQNDEPLVVLTDSPKDKNSFSPIPARLVTLLNNEFLYTVDFKASKKIPGNWMRKGAVSKGWFEKLPNTPTELEIEHEGVKSAVGNYQFVHNSVGQLPTTHFKPATFESIYNFLFNTAIKEFSNSLPEVITWSYDPNLLLPNSIDLQTFAANPDSCPPLKYMFLLDSQENIGTRISDAQSQGNYMLRNLLNLVATNTSQRLSQVWNDYKDVKIQLELNGLNINTIISEENGYTILQRSEGFKRFICFLLQISVRAGSDGLENCLILIDEPEIGLHPSGANDLRDELIRISESNLIVYATHSIFMVDPNNIGRHVIVKKNKEVTSLTKASESDLADEEVIFRSLGYSVFNNLNSTNIVFEGWRDKKLFRTYLQGSDIQPDDELRSLGLCHVKGVAALQLMSPIFEITKRKLFIVSDADPAAIQEKKNFLQKNLVGSWFTYKDINDEIECITGEDFLSAEHFTNIANEHFSAYALTHIDSVHLPSAARLKFVSSQLAMLNIPKEDLKSVLEDFKDKLFSNLEFAQIDSKYRLLVDGIRTQLQNQN